jgi:hypothetical protein
MERKSGTSGFLLKSPTRHTFLPNTEGSPFVATLRNLYAGKLTFVNTVPSAFLHQYSELFLLTPPSPTFLFSKLYLREQKIYC